MLSRNAFDLRVICGRAFHHRAALSSRLVAFLLAAAATTTAVLAQEQDQPSTDQTAAAGKSSVGQPSVNKPPAGTTVGKEPNRSGSTAAGDLQSTMAEPSLEVLRQHIEKLNSPSYRTRQLAIWYLEQNAARALPLLREAGETTDLNIGAEIVSLLSSQAMTPDPVISVAAHEALKHIAGGERSVTAVSYLAHSALAGIADRQEVLARESLLDLNVEMGPLRMTIGGTMQNEPPFPQTNIVHVTSDFAGTEQDMRLFRFLRSYETAYLEGDKITEKLLREVLAMPGLKRIVLKGPAITNDLLPALFDVASLEHLELVYTTVDDAAIDTIVDLPLVDSLRIFGARISREGADRIKKELDGLDIYIGRGGFLGVQTKQNDLRVERVVTDSGADRGGIETQDLITHVNDKPIKTFNQLRDELANFGPGEMVTVTVERFGGLEPGRPLGERLSIKLDITLGLQDTPLN